MEVNRILLSDKASTMFATCFYGILNTRTGELRYCCAGHNPPYRIGSGGVITALELKGGPPLGLFSSPYEAASLRFDPGDSLFLYTDGVPEANNAQLEDFTDERLVEVLGGLASCGPQTLVATVSSHVHDFAGGAPQSDDITMLAARWSPQFPTS